MKYVECCYLTFVLGIEIIYIYFHLCYVPNLGQVIVFVHNIICTRNLYGITNHWNYIYTRLLNGLVSSDIHIATSRKKRRPCLVTSRRNNIFLHIIYTSYEKQISPPNFVPYNIDPRSIIQF